MTLRILGGRFKGRNIKTPKSSSTRPTQAILRGAVFNICQHETEGAVFLDLFAGSGAMGFEALSRGAAQVVFVEKNRYAAAVIRENIALLQAASSVSLISCDAQTALQRLSSVFTIIYVDPPYDISPIPFVKTILAFGLLAPGGLLFLEERSGAGTSPPMFSPQLLFIDTRRFGDAALHQYRLVLTNGYTIYDK